MHNTLIPTAIFFAGIVILQIFNRNAIKQLSSEDKVRLVDFSSGVAIWRLIPLIFIVLGFAGFMYLKPSLSTLKIGLALYLLLIVVSSLISNIVILRKYRALGFPESYIRTTLINAILVILMLVGFFAWNLMPFLSLPSH